MSNELTDAESFSRPAKALVDAGIVGSFGDAGAHLHKARPQVAVGVDAVTAAHHAAVLTIVETACRAFGNVDILLPDTIATTACLVPGLGALTLGDSVRNTGATVVRTMDQSRPVLVVGEVAVVGVRTLQVTWDGWFAHVDVNGQRLPERGNMPLSAVAAGALAVTECFKVLLGDLEATYRNRSLNLWQPAIAAYPTGADLPGPNLVGPVVKYLPSQAWIVGLGHLGQAFAWCWRLLPYLDRSQCLVVLHDFDKVSVANRTTGVFTQPGDVGRMKTRVVAAALEEAGFATRLIERRLAEETRRQPQEPTLALLGMDKVEPRRLISGVGWEFAVDVGLGSGPIDFTGVSIHTFPAAGNSGALQAWKQTESGRRAASARAQQAYRDAAAGGASSCGLVQLSETAVAAPFVGVIAACIAVSEPIRVLHGQDATEAAAIDVGRRQSWQRETKPTRAPIAYVSADPNE